MYIVYITHVSFCIWSWNNPRFARVLIWKVSSMHHCTTLPWCHMNLRQVVCLLSCSHNNQTGNKEASYLRTFLEIVDAIHKWVTLNVFVVQQAFQWPGSWFNIKMASYQYRKSYCGDKAVGRSSYLHHVISYTGKMASLYSISPLILLWL